MEDHYSQESDEELNAQGHGSTGNSSLHHLHGVSSGLHDKPHLIGDREGRIRCILGSACTNPQGNRGHKISAYVTWHSGNVCKDCSAHFCCNGCNRKHRLPSGQCNITLFKGRLYPYTLWEAAVAHRQGIAGQKRSRPSDDYSDPAAAKPAYTSAASASQERKLSQQLGSNWLTRGLQEAASAWQSFTAPAKDQPNYTQAQDQQVHWLQQWQQQWQQQQLPQQQQPSRHNASSSSSQLAEQPPFQHHQQQHNTAVAAAAAAEGGLPPDVAALRSQLLAAVQCEAVARMQPETQADENAGAEHAPQSKEIQQLQLQLEEAWQENAALRQALLKLRVMPPQGQHDIAAGCYTGSDTAMRRELLAVRQEAAAYKRQAAALRQVLATARQFSSIMLPMLTSILEADSIQQQQQQQQQQQRQGSSADESKQLVQAATTAKQGPQQQQEPNGVACMQATEPKLSAAPPPPTAAAAAANDGLGHSQVPFRMFLTGIAGDRRKSLEAPAAAAAAAAALTPEQHTNQSGHLRQGVAGILLRAGSCETLAAPQAAQLSSCSEQQDLSAALMQAAAAAAAAAAAGGSGSSHIDPAAVAVTAARSAVPESSPRLPAAAAAAAEERSVAICDATAAHAASFHTATAEDDPPRAVPGVRYTVGADYEDGVHALKSHHHQQLQQQQQQLDGGGGVDSAAVAADLLVSLSRLHSIHQPT